MLAKGAVIDRVAPSNSNRKAFATWGGRRASRRRAATQASVSSYSERKQVPSGLLRWRTGRGLARGLDGPHSQPPDFGRFRSTTDGSLGLVVAVATPIGNLPLRFSAGFHEEFGSGDPFLGIGFQFFKERCSQHNDTT